MIIDLRFIEINYELWGLSEFLKDIDNNLIRTQKARKAITDEYLQQIGDDIKDDEWNLAYQEMYEITERIFPKTFRNTFIIMLWACYESGIRKIVKSRGDKFDKRDRRGFIKKSEDYFKKNLELSLEGEWYDKEIRFLYELRNALVHGNGWKEHVEPNIWEKLQRCDQIGIDLQTDSIILTNELLHRLFKMVENILLQLIKIVKKDV